MTTREWLKLVGVFLAVAVGITAAGLLFGFVGLGLRPRRF
jgi:hypothetical protein